MTTTENVRDAYVDNTLAARGWPIGEAGERIAEKAGEKFDRWVAGQYLRSQAEALWDFRKRLIADQLHNYGVVLPDVSSVIDDLMTEADGLMASAQAEEEAGQPTVHTIRGTDG